MKVLNLITSITLWGFEWDSPIPGSGGIPPPVVCADEEPVIEDLDRLDSTRATEHVTP